VVIGVSKSFPSLDGSAYGAVSVTKCFPFIEADVVTGVSKSFPSLDGRGLRGGCSGSTGRSGLPRVFPRGRRGRTPRTGRTPTSILPRQGGGILLEVMYLLNGEGYKISNCIPKR